MTYKVHLDGYDQIDLITGKGPSKRHEVLYFAEGTLGAVRINDYKYRFIDQPNGWLGEKTHVDVPYLINLRLDPFELLPSPRVRLVEIELGPADRSCPLRVALGTHRVTVGRVREVVVDEEATERRVRLRRASCRVLEPAQQRGVVDVGRIELGQQGEEERCRVGADAAPRVGLPCTGFGLPSCRHQTQLDALRTRTLGIAAATVRTSPE